MNPIVVDGKEVGALVPQSLPMLIHGAEGSGASLYTICLAAKWFSQKYQVLFLCGFPMAEEEFAKQVDGKYATVHFFTKEKVEEFKQAVKLKGSSETIIFIKNAELFDEGVFNLIEEFDNRVISGDIEEARSKQKILSKKYVTYVYFSPLHDVKLPKLNKYEGFLVSGDYQGVTKLG
ncbi:hypothetical protein IT087_02210 [Candidatus Uhrbacteria bacterium]|nr:hypothetical protein [Candidatus Uhrbacteria bacterium]